MTKSSYSTRLRAKNDNVEPTETVDFSVKESDTKRRYSTRSRSKKSPSPSPARQSKTRLSRKNLMEPLASDLNPGRLPHTISSSQKKQKDRRQENIEGTDIEGNPYNLPTRRRSSRPGTIGSSNSEDGFEQGEKIFKKVKRTKIDNELPQANTTSLNPITPLPSNKKSGHEVIRRTRNSTLNHNYAPESPVKLTQSTNLVVISLSSDEDTNKSLNTNMSSLTDGDIGNKAKRDVFEEIDPSGSLKPLKSRNEKLLLTDASASTPGSSPIVLQPQNGDKPRSSMGRRLSNGSKEQTTTAPRVTRSSNINLVSSSASSLATSRKVKHLESQQPKFRRGSRKTKNSEATAISSDQEVSEHSKEEDEEFTLSTRSSQISQLQSQQRRKAKGDAISYDEDKSDSEYKGSSIEGVSTRHSRHKGGPRLRSRQRNIGQKKKSIYNEQSSDDESADDILTKQITLQSSCATSKTSSPSEVHAACYKCSNADFLLCTKCEVSVCEQCNVLAGRLNQLDTLAEESINDPQLGSWECFYCLHYRGNVDSLLTYKEPEDQHPKLYLVKWEGMSYHHLAWVMEPWLRFISPAKLRNFCDRVVDEGWGCPLTREDVIDEEWLVPELVFDFIGSTKTREHLHRLKLSAVDQILVKWTGLPYRESTWEPYLSLPQDHKIKLTPLVQRHLASLKIPFCELEVAQPVTFQELKVQPSFINKGTLYPYQLDGLKKANIYPFLVIVPKAVLPNWFREFKVWAPNLHVSMYAGGKDELSTIRNTGLFKGHLKAHVLLSTYNTVMIESAQFKRLSPWAITVLDEGQRLKSAESKTFQTLCQLPSLHRILLTGTPLQNNLKELFNLMHFMDPNKFKDEEDFLMKYSELNDKSVAALHELLQPYFLRRTKVNVLPDLPKRFEVTIPVSMTPLQREICKAALSKNLKLLESIAPERIHNKMPINRSSLTNIFMELRKCLNHPYLISGVEPLGDGANDQLIQQRLIDASGKLKLLHRLLKLLRSQGHRVLLFSQFKLVLDIIEDYLVAENIPLARIDGDTSSEERQSRIDQFNKDGSTQFIFLLTTRAGGVGMNLATADTVIIYDMDFNPHSDLQALSRAHRIGQKKDVLVLRMVTRSSIEERILEIAKQKMVLDHLIIEKMGDVDLDPVDIASIIRFGVMALFAEEDEKEKELFYTDQELLELIDRSKLAKQAEVDSANEKGLKKPSASFGIARIWATNKDSPADSETADNKDDLDATNHWQELLQKRIANSNQTSETQLGRGARKRTVRVLTNVDYSSSDDDKFKGKNYRHSKIANSNSRKNSTKGHDDSDYQYVSPSSSSSVSSSTLVSATPIINDPSPIISAPQHVPYPNLSQHPVKGHNLQQSLQTKIACSNRIEVPNFTEANLNPRPSSDSTPNYPKIKVTSLNLNSDKKDQQQRQQTNLPLQLDDATIAMVNKHRSRAGLRELTLTQLQMIHQHQHAVYGTNSPANISGSSQLLQLLPTTSNIPPSPITAAPSRSPSISNLHYFCTWCQVNHHTQCPMYQSNHSVQELKQRIRTLPQLLNNPYYGHFANWAQAQACLPQYRGPPPDPRLVHQGFPNLSASPPAPQNRFIPSVQTTKIQTNTTSSYGLIPISTGSGKINNKAQKPLNRSTPGVKPILPKVTVNNYQPIPATPNTNNVIVISSSPIDNDMDRDVPSTINSLRMSNLANNASNIKGVNTANISVQNTSGDSKLNSVTDQNFVNTPSVSTSGLSLPNQSTSNSP